ncbi:adenylate/guanylate cyclase domain-containing protein [Nocardioides sp. AE5]|uniref:adenylate/guanylate cyclase domain-containing protein n=1 Tax=Nocardioides sp. AE5 TaxID=2962573 RepID=UPI0028814E86|nr:adenylate/guanylate cyclase domain-containing protein [Nocardioides sp. AE5]MDT0200940.1 adenylate/guanylate cyclase domain-containing protein [Nocardioides sp. AE5]
MPTAQVLALVLAIALMASLGVAITLQVRLSRTRRELAALRRQLASNRRPGRPPSLARQATQVTTHALRTVVDTAAKVREQGVSGFLASSIEELTGIAIANRSEIAQLTGADGTITIFFSDIVDSTAMNEKLGDQAWIKVLERHDSLVRKQIAAHRGHVVKTQGDGFMVVFADPADAIATALGIQDRLAQLSEGRRGLPVSVRMGMHVGTAIERDGDWFGRNVAMAARVAAQADAERILVSEEVREIVGDDPFLDFVDPVSVELKGFPGVHTLWRAVARTD